MPYSPLGKGFLTGEMGRDAPPAKGDFRASLPRFTPEAMERNQVFVDLLKQVADDNDATPAQVALAWLMAQRPYIVPIPGTTKLHRLEENLAAVNISLSDAALQQITARASELEAEGERYAPQQLAMVGREAPLARTDV